MRVDMFPLTLLSVFLCLATLPVIFCSCGAMNCSQGCYTNSLSCPTFDCEQAVTQQCYQYCLEPSKTPCNTLTCSAKQASCTQFCKKCPKATKLVCSSAECEQTCDGPFCDMECTKEVNVCKQTCAPNSTCLLTCPESVNCQRGGCEVPSTKCTYPASEPATPAPETTNCVNKTCKNTCKESCKGETLTCPTVGIKTCSLLCKDGCNMVCGNTFDKCTMNCTGNVKDCKTKCTAKACFLYHNDKLINPNDVSAVGTLYYSHILCGIVLFIALRW